jgi:hypothetical protein
MTESGFGTRSHFSSLNMIFSRYLCVPLVTKGSGTVVDTPVSVIIDAVHACKNTEDLTCTAKLVEGSYYTQSSRVSVPWFPSFELATPAPLPLVSVPPPPLEPGGRRATFASGWGGGGTQFGRLERSSDTLVYSVAPLLPITWLMFALVKVIFCRFRVYSWTRLTYLEEPIQLKIIVCVLLLFSFLLMFDLVLKYFNLSSFFKYFPWFASLSVTCQKPLFKMFSGLARGLSVGDFMVSIGDFVFFRELLNVCCFQYRGIKNLNNLLGTFRKYGLNFTGLPEQYPSRETFL